MSNAAAGVTVRQWRAEAVFYAGNALSTTLPGGPVLSATFVYRQQRQWGAFVGNLSSPAPALDLVVGELRQRLAGLLTPT